MAKSESRQGSRAARQGGGAGPRAEFDFEITVEVPGGVVAPRHGERVLPLREALLDWLADVTPVWEHQPGTLQLRGAGYLEARALPSTEFDHVTRELDRRLPELLRGGPELLTIIERDVPEVGRYEVKARFTPSVAPARPTPDLEDVPKPGDTGPTAVPPKPRREKRKPVPEEEKQEEQPPGEQPAAYRQAVAGVEKAMREAYRAMAERLQPHLDAYAARLNDYAKSLPHATYEEKQSFAKWVNAELRSHDLALKCPKHRVACFLQADVGDDPEAGRFQFCHYEGPRLVRVSRTSLPPLEVTLREADCRQQGWAAGETLRREGKGPVEKN